MTRISPDELRSRLRFDYRVCQALFGEVFSGKAYRNASDLQQGRNPITSEHDGHLARKYRIDFHVRTLVGPGQYSDFTTIDVDLEVRNYPFEEPPAWVTSTPIPYSPHFKAGTPICIGDLWEVAEGHMLLGELLIHIARILNWDHTTNRNYDGFNPEAVKYYQGVYGENPINKMLSYPLIPPTLFGGSQTTSPQELQTYEPQFSPLDNEPLFSPFESENVARSNLFRGIGLE